MIMAEKNPQRGDETAPRKRRRRKWSTNPEQPGRVRRRKRPPRDGTFNPDGQRVGYGVPPAHTQFKKGQSGNPKGRPKHSKNTSTIVRETLAHKVVSRVDGKERKVTVHEGIIQRHVQKALAGDHNSTKLILGLMQGLEHEPASVEENADGADDLLAIDDAILDEFARQIRETSEAGLSRDTSNQPEESDDDET